MSAPEDSPRFGQLLQAYFCDYLINQRQVSDRTVASYRDLFRLLLHFAEEHRHCPPAALALNDLDAGFIIAFLDHLEKERCNGERTRNARLAAIRSFLHYAVLQDPCALASVQGVFAIPLKRYDRPAIRYLSMAQMTAILEAPDANTWSGRRDRALLGTLYNTGARVSEIIALRRADLELQSARAVHLHGKGRKERIIPLWKQTAEQLRRWLGEIADSPQTPLFPNRFGQPMSRSGVEERLQGAVHLATVVCPSLAQCTVSPHVIRHTTALHMLQSGVDLAVIALWLGHESVTTTHGYVEADLSMKEQALGKLQPPEISTARYRPPKDLLSFLDTL